MSNRRLFLQEMLILPGVLFGIEDHGLPLLGQSHLSTQPANATSLPGEYFRRLAPGLVMVRNRMKEAPRASLPQIESQSGWAHFPYTILAAAVFYGKKDPANSLYKDPSTLQLALQIGDLLAEADKHNEFTPRLDSYRDAYMWVEAYHLLEAELGAERSQQWKSAIERNIGLLESDAAAWKDCPAYTENFLGTSPNHYAWWSATLLVGGKYLNRPAWCDLGSFILHRFATTEQNPDGYWGEHNPNGPTIGYDYLTTLAVGVYWEHTHDPDALRALKKATGFFSHFTYPDGHAVELLNDRNRYWEVSPWAHFAFSHFSEGRGYAAMLLGHILNKDIDWVTMGLLAQDALYFHSGPVERCTPQLPSYSHHLSTAPIGIRKEGPWVVGLSGIIDTPLPLSQWFLDRQANVSLFHKRAGLIIAGANSKSQPELATFLEKYRGVTYTKPIGSRLTMAHSEDRLALAHHTFSCEVTAPKPTEKEARLQFQITGRGPAPEEAYLSLQLCLRAGAMLETATGQRITLTHQKVELTPEMLGGAVTYYPASQPVDANGTAPSSAWTLKLNQPATLSWPIFPYNPYRGAPETKLEHAIALLRIPLRLKSNSPHYVRPDEQDILVSVRML